MSSAKSVPADKLVSLLKEKLKVVKELQAPEWAKLVKTGVSKVRPAEQEDFWHTRAASIMRKLYIEGTVGVERLSTFYGGRKKYGHAPAHFRRAGRNIIRKILQQLEKAGLVEKAKAGRKLSNKGKSFVDKAVKEAG